MRSDRGSCGIHTKPDAIAAGAGLQDASNRDTRTGFGSGNGLSFLRGPLLIATCHFGPLASSRLCTPPQVAKHPKNLSGRAGPSQVNRPPRKPGWLH